MYSRVYANGPTGTELAELIRSLKKHSSDIGGLAFSDSIVESNLDVDFITYLDSDDYRFQEESWVKAFKKSVSQTVSASADVAIVLSNAPYFRKSRFFPPAILEVFEEFSPKAIVTFIEEGHVAWARIRRREERQRSRSVFRLKDMFTWRSVSIMYAATIARHLRIPHYIFPIKQTRSDLYRLLAGSRPRVYLSFPITHVREDRKAVDEINEFRRLMHEKFCSFDPITADDRAPQHVYEKLKRSGSLPDTVRIGEDDRWPRGNLEPLVDDVVLLGSSREPVYPIEIPVDQVREVSEPAGEASEPSEIDKNILYRDVLFVLQSDVVVAYRPNYKGRLSVGSYFEMQYAVNVAKKRVLVYWDKSEDGDPSTTPFMGFGTFYNDVDRLVEELETSWASHKH